MLRSWFARLFLILLLCGIGITVVWWLPDDYKPEKLPALPGQRTTIAERYYQSYYPHYYEHYRKTLDHASAHYYANYYANYYARYFASDAYQEALKYALPPATQENMAYPATSSTANMKTSALGVGMIQRFEGFSETVYMDSGGKATIGFGHLVREGEFYTTLSKAEASTLMQQDLQLAEAIVKRKVTVPLNQNQFAALVSLVYNIGPGNFSSSTLLKKLNAGDYRGASNEFLRWKHVAGEPVAGLERRRAIERTLFLRDA